jgi:hypothetical protein
MIIEAIGTVDLKAVRLVDLSTETHIPTTTVALPKSIRAGLKAISKTRNASMNVLVNRIESISMTSLHFTAKLFFPIRIKHFCAFIWKLSA